MASIIPYYNDLAIYGCSQLNWGEQPTGNNVRLQVLASRFISDEVFQ